MGIFDGIRKAFGFANDGSVGLTDPELAQWLGIDPATNKKALNEATYFTCLKILSETMGKLPLKYYRQGTQGRIRAEPTRASLIMTTRPNEYMSAATFWTVMEYNCEHYGNAYAWIQTRRTNKGSRYGREREIIGLWPMDPSSTEVLIDDGGYLGDSGRIYYRYSDKKSGKTFTFRSDSVLHIKTWCTRDGIMGKSVREILADMVGGASESQTYLNNLYKSGLTASMALQYTAELDKKKRMALQAEYNSLLTGARNAGKVVAVPVGFQLQPLKMSLADAQFADLKKYSALQIAAAFGIKPNHLNNYEKSSYANSEMQQLSFLVDTMLYRITIYEQEINAKCLTLQEQTDGLFYKFNEKALLRADSKTQIDTIAEAVQNALYTPNEGREYLDLPAEEGGDVLICNGNYIPLTAVGTQYARKEGSNGGDSDQR